MNKIDWSKPSPEQLLSGLFYLKSLQTEQEKDIQASVEKNEKGFNGADAEILTNIADWYSHNCWISERQFAVVKRKLAKYSKTQLCHMPDEMLLPAINIGRPEKKEKLIKVTLKGAFFRIAFPAMPSDEIRTKLKKAGASWVPADKEWTVYATQKSMELLKELLPVNTEIPIPPVLVKETKPVKLDIPRGSTMYPEMPSYKGISVNLEGFGFTLRDYQIESIQLAKFWNGSLLLADDMGLGKTIQSLGYVYDTKNFPCLIVCPASVKGNWVNEIRKGFGLAADIVTLSGRKPYAIRKTDFVIINYDIIAYWRKELIAYGFKCVICDESHKLKHSGSNRTEALLGNKKAKGIIADIPSKLFLTGTPLELRPHEIYTSWAALSPKYCPAYLTYIRRYCAATYNGYGWDVRGASNVQELHEYLKRTVMIRRRKGEVEKSLPPNVRQVIPVACDKKELAIYAKMEADFISFLREAGYGHTKITAALRAEVLVRRQALRLQVARCKYKATVEYIKEVAETQDKLIVFGIHKEIIASLQAEFKDLQPVVITGQTKQADRTALIKEFQENPERKMFLGNMDAAGVGITLTAAAMTVFTELGYAGSHDQAEARAHRIGQTNTVYSQYLVATDTIDEIMMQGIDTARTVSAGVLDGKEMEADNGLTYLIKTLMGKGKN